jgi:hypothetical protein
MAVTREDRLKALVDLKAFVQRMRAVARADPGIFSGELLRLADDIADDAARLEAELIEAGYQTKAADTA